jgi:glucose/arabinose dehydrogenase
VVGGTFFPDTGPFPQGYRDQYYFADFRSKFIARLDFANGNAVYAFAWLSGSPVDLLAGTDGALYVLTRGGITRISAS